MLKNFVGSSWEKLLEGNKRFVSGDLVKKDFSLEKRKELLKGKSLMRWLSVALILAFPQK